MSIKRSSNQYIIGLTGNIASGKSVTRKMLEHLGAYGIDADALAHRAMAQKGPAYNYVVRTFGTWILDESNNIDRKKLGKIVFSDENALTTLENLLHPNVRKAIEWLIEQTNNQVIVIEAIKLIESGLADDCDAIWVTTATPSNRLTRLVTRRKMPDDVALQRVNAQPPESEKIRAADVVIYNDGSLKETWEQVQNAWELINLVSTEGPAEKVEGEIHVIKLSPTTATQLTTFINSYSGQPTITLEDTLMSFGAKGYWGLFSDDALIGVAGLRVENFIARIDDLYLSSSFSEEELLTHLMQTIEDASNELLSEVALVIISTDMYNKTIPIWNELGYMVKQIRNINVGLWQEAAMEMMSRGNILLFKQLRENRVLRPV